MRIDEDGLVWLTADEWRARDVDRQMQEHRRGVTQHDREAATINLKPIATSRDAYGWRSIQSHRKQADQAQPNQKEQQA